LKTTEDQTYLNKKYRELFYISDQEHKLYKLEL